MDYSFQEEGIDWLRRQRRGLLADEPGLGKSRQLLMAAEGSTLVVAPAMVLDGGVWADETQKWRPDLDVTYVPYSGLSQRVKTVKGGTTPTGKLRPEYNRRWGTVIFDEAHYLKGRHTNYTKAALSLTSERTYLATGTPIPNWAHELFVPLQLLWPNEARPGQEFGSFWRWVSKWFEVGPTAFSKMAIHGPLDDTPEGWQKFFKDNFRGRFLQRKRDDVLGDLPPMTTTYMDLPMRPAQKKLYKELKADYIAWTETGEEVSAWSSGGLFTKLTKICTGTEIEDPSSRASNKLDALMEHIQNQAQPSLVACQYRNTVAAAVTRIQEIDKTVCVITGSVSKRDRLAAVQGFQQGRYDVLVATIDTVAEGLTLTRADTVHMLERSYRPSKNEQVIRRIHRIGQERPVNVIHYLSKNSVDQRIVKLLAEKTDHQVKALTAAQMARLL